MSIQVRVLGAIAALLVLTLVCGGGFLLLHARSIAELEVNTAFKGAESSVRETLQGDVEHTVTMREVVASFEGQRHVRAALINEDGRVIVSSRIANLSNPAPRWFVRLMQPPPLSARIPINLPKFPCVVQLTSDPDSELAEIWSHASDAFLAMSLFCAAVMAVVWAAFAYALRFVGRLRTGLLAVADGSQGARLDVKGPPELASISRGFNHMAERLENFSESNRRLQRQIQSVQEEERAGIARDLHDEVGPYLFAIQVDANAVSKSGDPKDSERGREIRDAALHIQRHVKDILRQLRPNKSLDFGLKAAISDLVSFWARRYPAIRFDVTVEGDRQEERHGEAAYYIVQESISNAVRHGDPKSVRIAVTAGKDELQVCVEDDGGGLRHDAHTLMSLGHVGLAGMEERVRSLNGRFTIEEMDGSGVRIRALFPRPKEAALA
jgi:two-component system sensor histidine kinase UhpB